MKLGTNVPMGPLTLADFIGLDTCLSILEVLHRDLGDSKYRACPLLVNYVDAGYLGVKSGRGFYDYKKKWQWYCFAIKIIKIMFNNINENERLTKY